MSKVLIVASVVSMIDQFNRQNIKLLKEMGFDVHIACNFIEGNTCSSEKIQHLKKDLQSEGVTFSQVDFARNVTKILQNFQAYRQIKRLLDHEKYDLVHCHSPIGGLLTRIVANKHRQQGTKVIYTAHGFHFYKGAPLKNWLIYFPVEWILSFFTDVLITINKEDYTRAKKFMKAKKVEYVPGVGIDILKFSGSLSDEQIKIKKNEIGVPDDAKIILSAGELNENKNHEIVIRALAKLKNKKLHYVIAGIGNLRDYLLNLSKELDVENNVHLIGFRSDIAELYKISDIFVHSSFREGLPVALMEAMASGLPCIVSRIRGNIDLIFENKNGYFFDPTSEDDIIKAIQKAMMIDKNLVKEYNRKFLKKYSKESVNKKILHIYREIKPNF